MQARPRLAPAFPAEEWQLRAWVLATHQQAPGLPWARSESAKALLMARQWATETLQPVSEAALARRLPAMLRVTLV